jgi:hypothetical protein
MPFVPVTSIKPIRAIFSRPRAVRMARSPPPDPLGRLIRHNKRGPEFD